MNNSIKKEQIDKLINKKTYFKNLSNSIADGNEILDNIIFEIDKMLDFIINEETLSEEIIKNLEAFDKYFHVFENKFEPSTNL